MPPSPRLTIRLDPEKYHALCADMGIKAVPPVTFQAKGGKVYGLYHPLTNRITIFHGQQFYEVNRLRAVNAELVDTLLHELRHAWQKQEWGPDFYKQGKIVRAERDADDFAKRNLHNWRGVIRVGRTVHSRLPG